MGDFESGRRIDLTNTEVDCYTYVSRKLHLDRTQVKEALNRIWNGEDIPSILKATKLKSGQISKLSTVVDEWAARG